MVHYEEVEEANSHRNNENSATFKLNEYADWTDEEIK